MKEIFRAFAEYNKNVNSAVYTIISKMDSSEIIQDLKTYHSSLKKNLSHVLNSDFKWLNRLMEFISDKDILRNVNEQMTLLNNNSDYFSESLPSVITLRNTIDKLIIQMIENIPEEMMKKDYTIQFGDKKVSIILWQLLMQWFNHHTHHRGQISVMLDYFGVENDFSMVLDKIQ